METLRRRKTEENVYSMNNFGILIKEIEKKYILSESPEF